MKEENNKRRLLFPANTPDESDAWKSRHFQDVFSRFSQKAQGFRCKMKHQGETRWNKTNRNFWMAKNGTDQPSFLTKSAQYIRIRYVYKVEFTLFQTFYLLFFLRRVINTLPKIKEESQWQRTKFMAISLLTSTTWLNGFIAKYTFYALVCDGNRV